jgi:uncharacterized membrane protein YfhO
VPYDEGFTAFVNGVETEIEKVNYAMCAVYVPAGDNTITFEYHTPYLNTGIMLTLGGWALYVGYICILMRKNKKK